MPGSNLLLSNCEINFNFNDFCCCKAMLSSASNSSRFLGGSHQKHTALCPARSITLQKPAIPKLQATPPINSETTGRPRKVLASMLALSLTLTGFPGIPDDLALAKLTPDEEV